MTSGTGGMVKRNVQINNNAMPTSRGHTISDAKQKFSDRLKVYFSTDGQQSDNSEADDPYTFSDSEVAKPVANHVSKRSAPVRRKSEGARRKVCVASAADSSIKPELNCTDHGKTMHRLQAQIAKNKVFVKHSRDMHDSNDSNHLDKGTRHSITDALGGEHAPAGRKLPPTGKPLPAHLKARRASTKATHHEALQRIHAGQVWHAPQPYGPLSGSAAEPLDTTAHHHADQDDVAVYQRHWFSKQLETVLAEDGTRQARLELTRAELARHLSQISGSRTGARSSQDVVSLVTAAKRRARASVSSRSRRAPGGPLVARQCNTDGCGRPALPCTLHCTVHIMNNSDQVLFDFCTAKFADNTQCSVPVFDIAHELPLCIEHARKRDNYNRMCLETKPKKPRRKVKPSAMIRPQKRSKKRKKSQKSTETSQPQAANIRNSFSDVSELNVCETSSAYESSEDIGMGAMSESEFVTIKEEHHIGDQDVVEQVLAMQEEVNEDLELVTVEQALVTHASRLLDETDFTNVLNQIPPDEFNDLFAVDRNGEYEPSREDTEELERALEAVDKDVKCLEKLSQTQGLLGSLLDEHTLVESLVQIPDVFHNGYSAQCVEPVAAAAATAAAVSAPPPAPIQLQSFHPGLHAVDGIFSVQPQAHMPS